eukprot:jgi/Undpi1/4323/HiC_scaffold_17.g07689.m1
MVIGCPYYRSTRKMSRDSWKEVGLKGLTTDKFAALLAAATTFVEALVDIGDPVAVASMSSPVAVVLGPVVVLETTDKVATVVLAPVVVETTD